MEATNPAMRSEPVTRFAGWPFAILLGVIVFLSRWILTVPVYFVDGPGLVAAIRSGIYVIQPPGYWLLAVTAGLFPDPETGLAVLNALFSALGAVSFYFLCRRLVDESLARLGALAYTTIFFAWFAGSIHSSYASQLLAAPLLFLSFLRYAERPTVIRLSACAAVFAIGAGFRPSDGAFLTPVFCYLGWRFVRTKSHRGLLLGIAAALCLAWYIPTRLALGENAAAGQAGSLAVECSILLAGITAGSVANIIRVVVPLAIACVSLVPAIWYLRSDWRLPLFLWTAPGVAFLLLIYMADATYLCFASGAFVLAAVLSTRRKFALAALATCVFLNTSFFLFARPVPGGTAPAALVINYYAVKYTRFGLEQRWMQIITDALRDGISYPANRMAPKTTGSPRSN